MATLYTETLTYGGFTIQLYADYTWYTSNTEAIFEGTLYLSFSGTSSKHDDTAAVTGTKKLVRTSIGTSSGYYQAISIIISNIPVGQSFSETAEVGEFFCSVPRTTSSQSVTLSVNAPVQLTSWSIDRTETLRGTKSITVPALTSYTIAYNANGGSDAPANQTKYYGVDLTLSDVIPTRSGYTFVNWNTAANGTGTSYSSSGTYTANAGTTLYAQWIESGPSDPGSVYIGVNDVARKVNTMYVGVNGVAKKVTKAYVGVDNVATLIFQDN